MVPSGSVPSVPALKLGILLFGHGICESTVPIGWYIRNGPCKLGQKDSYRFGKGRDISVFRQKGGTRVLPPFSWPNILWCSHWNALSSLMWSYFFGSPHFSCQLWGKHWIYNNKGRLEGPSFIHVNPPDDCATYSDWPALRKSSSEKQTYTGGTNTQCHSTQNGDMCKPTF